MYSRAIGAVLLCASLSQPTSAAQKSVAPRSPSSAAPATPSNAAADPADLEFWTSGRYRLTPSDVIELTFPYVPEFDQVVAVQPDGYASLRGVGELFLQSRTLPELRQMLYDAYAPIIREPVFTVVLKEFEKPYFVATGEVQKPGKFELRGATTVTQALAFAGGWTRDAKHSQVVLFRRFSNDLVEVKPIDVKKMYSSRDMSEDPLLRPGDTVYVPRSTWSVVAPFIPKLYVDPFAFLY